MKNLLKIAVGVVLLYIIYANFFDNTCKYSGCKQKGIGWVKCSKAPAKIAAFCNDGVVRYKETGGYCSKNHAIADN